MSVLEQDTTKKRRVQEKLLKSDKYEFEFRDSKKYKIEKIIDIVVYRQEAKNQLLDLFYLIS